jgi:acetoin utilization deacetylase AcuC-like enzyme
LKKINELAKKFAKERTLITLEGGYEVDKQAKAVYNCLRIFNDQEEKLIKENPQDSSADLLNHINSKLIPSIKENLSPFWDCF